MDSQQGCQMVYFKTKNPNLGKFWSSLDGKMLKYFMAIYNILGTFGKLYDHLVPLVFIRYIFSGFGIMYQEKFGNPDTQSCLLKIAILHDLTEQNLNC
jgi:hypothetical protein